MSSDHLDKVVDAVQEAYYGDMIPDPDLIAAVRLAAGPLVSEIERLRTKLAAACRERDDAYDERVVLVADVERLRAELIDARERLRITQNALDAVASDMTALPSPLSKCTCPPGGMDDIRHDESCPCRKPSAIPALPSEESR